MPRTTGQKLKILYILNMLQEHTDEENVLPVSRIISELDRNGIKAERKSIYDDIENLRVMGYDIEYKGTKPTGYYMASREFELAELKMLVDIVQSSKFLTKKKSNELIKKISTLTSTYNAKKIKSQVYVADRIKTMNESIYYNVDILNDAIVRNRKITFTYMEWSADKKLVPRRNGKEYTTSPWILHWDSLNYYLIGYDTEAVCIKYYRVDKMKNISVTEDKRDGKDIYMTMDIAAYTNKIFGMYSGKEEYVTVRVKKSLLGVMIDRFGTDIPILKQDEEYFETRLNVNVSEQFYGWLFGLGTNIKIIKPEHVRENFIKYARDVLNIY